MASNDISIDHSKVMARAKRAYEFARFRRSLWSLTWVAPLTLTSLWLCGNTTYSLTLGALLSVAMIAALWRGMAWREGAILGAIAGTFVFMIPMISHATGFCCRYHIEMPLCIISGLIGGLIVSSRATKVQEQQASYLFSGGAAMILSGSLGCAEVGLGGAIGFAAAAALATLPVLVVARPSAT